MQHVLHLGARTRDVAANPVSVDPTGIAEWVTPERGVVTFTDASDVADRLGDVVRLVGRWIRVTS